MAAKNVKWYNFVKQFCSYIPTPGPSNSTLIPFQEKRRPLTSSNLYKNHYRNFVHCSQNLERIYLLINRRFDKQIVTESYQEMLLGTKENEKLIYAATWMNLRYIRSNGKIYQTKMCILYHSIYMKCKDRNKNSSCLGGGSSLQGAE